MAQKYYHKYQKALEAKGYRVDEHGYVWDSMGNQSAGEDNYGNVQSKDPNVNAICQEAEMSLFSKATKAVKKVATKAKPKMKKVRARNADGTLRGDNPDTPDVNEAWTYVEDK